MSETLGSGRRETQQTQGGLCSCLLTSGLFLFLSSFQPYLATLTGEGPGKC